MKHPGKTAAGNGRKEPPSKLRCVSAVAVDLRATVRKDPRSEIAGYRQKPKQASENLTQEIKGSVIALALTWDGARWPVRTLPPKARAFLTGRSEKIPSARKVAMLFSDDQVREIRVCWVPRLKGGGAVLSEPFQTPTGTRIGFQSVRTVRFGEVLGVIYRRK